MEVFTTSGRPLRSPRIALLRERENLRQTASAVGGWQFVRVELGLRAQVLEPFIEVELVIESVSLRVGEVSLADDAREVACAAEAMSNGLEIGAPRHVVLQDAVMMSVKAGENRGSRGTANRIAAIHRLERRATCGKRVEIGRTDTGVAHAAHRPRVMLVR